MQKEVSNKTELTPIKFLMMPALIKMSRPRFWLYLAGPLLIGFTAGINSLTAFTNPWLFILLLYFLWPANFYLYGVNDYFDLDTDILNAKKSGKEILLNQPAIRKAASLAIIISLIISSAVLLFIPGTINKAMFFAFILLAASYSVPPLRFKKLPFIDSLSNVLYALPGFIGYTLASGQLPPLTAVIAAWAWTAAMHLFSAIPDIAPDKAAGLKTSAVKLGKNLSLAVCTLLWLLFAAITIGCGFVLPLSWLFLIYPLVPLSLIFTGDLEKAYWRFPVITGFFGFLVFWHLLLSKFLF